MLSSINPDNLSDSQKIDFAKTGSGLARTLNERKSREIKEKAAQKQSLREDLSILYNLLLLATVVAMFVWISSLKMVAVQLFNDTTEEWKDIFYYSAESMGLVPPSGVWFSQMVPSS